MHARNIKNVTVVIEIFPFDQLRVGTSDKDQIANCQLLIAEDQCRRQNTRLDHGP